LQRINVGESNYRIVVSILLLLHDKSFAPTMADLRLGEGVLLKTLRVVVFRFTNLHVIVVDDLLKL